jgi:hypothetical protein
MGTKKITDRQRLMAYAMSATEEQLQDAVNLFKEAQAVRFPKQARKAPMGRKAATQARPTAIQSELPGTVAADGGASEAEAVEQPTRRGRKSADKFIPDPHMVAAIEEKHQAATAGD